MNLTTLYSNMTEHLTEPDFKVKRGRYSLDTMNAVIDVNRMLRADAKASGEWWADIFRFRASGQF